MDDKILSEDSDSNNVKIARAKKVAKFVTAKSVHFVVAGTLASLVPTENRREKFQAMVGSYVISGMIVKKATSFVSEEIDELLETLREIPAMFSPDEIED